MAEPAIQAMLKNDLFQEMIRSARAILTEVRRLMVTSPRSGKTYKRLSPGGRLKAARFAAQQPQSATTTRAYVDRLLNQPYSRAQRPSARPPTRGEKRILRYRNVAVGDYIYHRASAPGEPPAPDRGMAGGLISRLDLMVTETPVGYDIALGAGGDEVARYLEEGTRRMLPRPAWYRAVNTVRRTAGAGAVPRVQL